MAESKEKEKLRWYGAETPSGRKVFENLEEKFTSIFDSLRNGEIPDLKLIQGTVPDLRPMLITYGKIRIGHEFTRDQFLRRMYALIPELNKSINLIFEKMSVMSPMLGVVLRANDPCGFFRDLKEGKFPDYAGKMVENVSESVGSLCSLKSKIVDFLRSEITGIMPNTCRLAGEDLAIELLARGGSLENLSLMSGSSIQVLGAEKALFKHFTTGTRPPKHGVIFRFPGLSSMKPKFRGRAARVIANQLVLTLRADMIGNTLDLAPLEQKIKKAMTH